MLASSDESVAREACWPLAETGQKRYAPVLLRVLQSDRSGLWQSAANGLSHIESKRVIGPLLRILMDASAPDARREAAAYALAFSWAALADRRYSDPIGEAFLALLADRDAPPGVRAQVAEGLAYLHGACVGARDRRRKAYRGAGELLIDTLDDPAPQVRFWSAFALGSIRYLKALPALRRLARKDHARFAPWWTVGEEATDSIALLEGRMPSERTLRYTE
jgi:HEAT repeat protein